MASESMNNREEPSVAAGHARHIPEMSTAENRGSSAQADVAELLEAGLAHHRAGSLGEASAHYRRVLAAVPSHVDALYLLGVTAYQTDQPEMAIELIGKAIQQNENNPSYHIGYGLALQSLKRLDEALESCNRALTIEPDNAEAWNNRGLLLHELQRFDEALQSYDRALAVRTDFTEALNNRGYALQVLRRLNEAVASYDRALALKPNLLQAVINRMEALRDLGSPLNLFFSTLKARGFSPNHIIDVGANHGYWTRAALNYFPEAYYTLIEPQDHLKKDVQDLLAREDGKIRWIGAGVSDQPGILPFTISYRDDSSTFVFTPEAAEARGMRQIEVPMVTLNEIVRTSSAPFPQMVKIDAEGFDLRVIAGASELLGRTDIFLVEASIFNGSTDPGQNWGNTLENVMSKMSHAGYRLFDITDLNRSPKYGVLWLCEVAFLRNESPLLAGIDSYE
jgi:FkbM family methyltransferase